MQRRLGAGATDNVIGIALFIAIALLGIASTVLATIWTWRFLQRRHAGGVPTTLIVIVAAILAFWGLWLVFDVVWIAVAMVRLVERIASGNGGPAQQSR